MLEYSHLQALLLSFFLLLFIDIVRRIVDKRTGFRDRFIMFSELVICAFVGYARVRFTCLKPESDLINVGSIIMNTYILKIECGYAVIDTGYPGGFPSFVEKLNENRISLDEIKLIFVTHAHDDHVGFLRELVENTDAKVVVASEAIDRLKLGANKVVPNCGMVGFWAQRTVEFMSLIGNSGHYFPPVDFSEEDDRILHFDGMNTEILREHGIKGSIMELPGHTSDSIGLLLDDGRLFCGDAAMNGWPCLRKRTIFVENLQQFHASWDKILQSSAKTIYPSHGVKFTVNELRAERHSLSNDFAIYPYM